MNVQSVSAVGFYGIRHTREAGNLLRDKQTEYVEKINEIVIPYYNERIELCKDLIGTLKANLEKTTNPMSKQHINKQIAYYTDMITHFQQKINEAPEKLRKIYYGTVGNH